MQTFDQGEFIKELEIELDGVQKWIDNVEQAVWFSLPKEVRAIIMYGKIKQEQLLKSLKKE